jgi:plasmid maintenance system antidote protein VapI
MKHYTEGEVLKHLREQAERPDLTQAALAKKLGFSAQFINDVLGGRRALTRDLAESLGFRKNEYYLRKPVEESIERKL